MFKFMKANPDVFVKNIGDGVSKVLNSNGKYAFLLESAMNDYYAERECKLMRVGDLLDSKGYGIGFPTGSKLRDKMTKSILKLEKSREIPTLINKWWKEANITEPCDTKESTSLPTALNVNQIGGIFVLLAVGFVFAGLVAIIELYVDYRTKAYQWKVPFSKHLKKELQFAMRFMSSSKKPINSEIPKNKSRERLLLFDQHLGQTNEISYDISQPFSNFTDIDSPCMDRNECFDSSQDAHGNNSNSKYPWGLNSNL